MKKRGPLRRRIFISYAAVIVVFMLAVGWVTSRSMEQLYYKHGEHYLQSIVHLFIPQIDVDLTAVNMSHLDSLARNFSAIAPYRVTLIAKSGLVLGDSEASAAEMENHADRPEVVEAYQKGKGTSTRISPTLGKRMLYYAEPIELKGEVVGVVRTSIPLVNIYDALLEMNLWILIMGMTAIVIVIFLSDFLARSITSPLKEMESGALRFASGESTQRLVIPKAKELAGLAETLNRTGILLQGRINIITKQRNELEALLSSMAEGVLAFDTNERLLNINQAAADILEVDAAKSQGRLLQEVIRNPNLLSIIQSMLCDKENIQCEITFKKGLSILQVLGTMLKDAEGNEIGCLIVLHDITGIRRMEQVRRDFVANVSHEFRTPISAIKGYVETLLEGAMEDRDTAREFLEIIAGHMDSLNELINDLLTLSQIERETEFGAIPMQSGNLSDLIHTVRETFQLLAEKKGIKLEVEGEVEVQAKFNHAMMEHALCNLLSNAVKYSERGGEVKIGISEAGDELIIYVQDNGVGIEAEHLERIFERFYRVEKDRSRISGGTGLGLSIVKHVALAHKGRVEVDSVYGKGSTFRIIIPKSV